ncbi:nuclear transport factor 2 family protein [Pseudorhodoplanes sp.]|uniref:nuclear transport factor 2 family protein n=1 Tax=Pseudorhodoplanes sp. TaxID=1934341 RepID=UPI003D1236E2
MPKKNYTNQELSKLIITMFGDNDRRPFVEALPDNFEFKFPSATPYGGHYKGKAAFESFYASMLEKFYDSFVASIQQVHDAGDHLIAPIRIRARGKSGREMEIENCWIFRVENGAIVSAQAYVDTAKAAATAG